MATNVLAHVRRQGLAYLAIFLAVGGVSYAAATLPKNSVGTKQIKKHAVTLPKISPGARKALKGQRGFRGARGPQGPGAYRLFKVADNDQHPTLVSLPGGLSLIGDCPSGTAGPDLVAQLASGATGSWPIDSQWTTGQFGLHSSTGGVTNSGNANPGNRTVQLGYTGGINEFAIGTTTIERSVGTVFTVSWSIDDAVFTAPGESSAAHHCVFRGSVTPTS